MADKNPIFSVGNVKRDVLICLFGGSASICVPDVHRLAVFHEIGKAFPQAIQAFADGQVQALPDIGLLIHRQISELFGIGQGEEIFTVKIADTERILFHLGGQAAGSDGQLLFILDNCQMQIFCMELEFRPAFHRAPEVIRLYAKHINMWGSKFNGQQRAGESLPPVGYFCRGNIHNYAILHNGHIRNRSCAITFYVVF